MSFILDPWVETRSDNLNLRGYKGILDGKRYILYYDKTKLREVYFVGLFPNYFMSCRSDFTAISHYYEHLSKKFSNSYINRYDNQKLTKVYYYAFEHVLYSPATETDPVRYYRYQHTKPELNPEAVEADLRRFLVEFYNLGLDKHFCPEEPKSVKK